MPGQLSTLGANIALDAATGRATQTARTTYLALLTAAPTDATTVATMAEVYPGTNGYSRQAATWAAPSGDPSSTSNTATITWGPFTADPPNVTHIALVSSASGLSGDLVMYWTADVARNAANGESIQAAAGALVMTLD